MTHQLQTRVYVEFTEEVANLEGFEMLHTDVLEKMIDGLEAMGGMNVKVHTIMPGVREERFESRIKDLISGSPFVAEQIIKIAYEVLQPEYLEM